MALIFAKSLFRLNGCVRLGNLVKISGLDKRCISGCANNLQRNNVVRESISELHTSYGVNSRYFSSSNQSGREIVSKKEVPIFPPEELPSVPIVPIKSTPVFLHLKPFYRFKLTDKNLIEVIKKKVEEGEPYVGMFLMKDEKNDSKTVRSKDDLYPTGTFVKVLGFTEYDDSAEMWVLGNRRISIANFKSENILKIEGDGSKSEDALYADINNISRDDDFVESQVKELMDEILKVMDNIADMGTQHGFDLIGYLMSPLIRKDNPLVLGDFAAYITRETADPKELQQVLEERNIKKRLELCLTLLKKDFEWRSKPENRDHTFLQNPPTDY